MDTIRPDEIELRLHGLVREDHGRVPARVFANKLKQFVMALEAADLLVNGKTSHTYLLSSMHMSQPTAVVSEVLLDDNNRAALPAFPTFHRAIEAIKSSSQSEELEPVITKINLLASGSERAFGFAEVRDGSATVIRIDSFLKDRAYAARWQPAAPWFTGVCYSSYDGYLKFIDTRGDLPQVKLILSAGGNEIDCICRKEDIETLGVSIEKRVRIYGKAIHSPTQALPVRVEVSSIEIVGDPGDFSRWNGAFQSFDAASWDGEAAEIGE